MPPSQSLDNPLTSSPPTTSSSPSSPSSISSDRETVIIFDWDDTLLSSSYLSSKGFKLDTEKSRLCDVESGLKELESSVVQVLSLALQYGNVHVVTNAETGWVQLSAAKFLPGVVPLLSRLTIISARSTYECKYPESPLKWKFFAFQDKLAPTFASCSSKVKNILSFGDSHVEREAVRAVTRGLPNTRTKSVKFAERPSIEQLRRQIELVSNCFQYIHNHDGDLDLQLTVTINHNNNTNNQHANQNNSSTPNNNTNTSSTSPISSLPPQSFQSIEDSSPPTSLPISTLTSAAAAATSTSSSIPMQMSDDNDGDDAMLGNSAVHDSPICV